MQIGSVNPEFHRELIKEFCTQDPSKSDLEKRSSIGISENFEKFSQVSLAMIYDSSGCGVPWWFAPVDLLFDMRFLCLIMSCGVGVPL